MRIGVLFILLVSFIAVTSCNRKSVPAYSSQSPSDSLKGKVSADTVVKVKKDKRRIFPDPGKFKAFLDSNLPDSLTGNPPVPLMVQNEKILIDSLTRHIYKYNDNNPFWKDSTRCHYIIKLLERSRFDGLMPEDYGIPELDSLFDICFHDKKRKNDTIFWSLELQVTKNYLHYLNHLRFGKTDPESIFRDWDYQRDPHLPFTPKEFAMLFANNPDSLVREMRPQYPLYEVLRSVLYRVDTIRQHDFEWDVIPYPGKDLKLGDTATVLLKVKHRLQSVGLISHDSSAVFDEELLEALKYFQKHVGITPTGKIDKTTIYKLNFTLQEIENVARVNMERCRWLLKGQLPDYYIIVNIADYYLRIYKNDKEVYKTKVVVGATNKETPSFHSKMTAIEFYPHWSVPTSIRNNEILPILKSDPDFITRNNMELMLGDSVVTVTDFSSYTKKNFPFSIRQKPGVDNSLGVVKFIFPNPYNVYFHDTPSKGLFERDVRAFSHGCVRVHKPLDLANFILSSEGFTSRQVNEIVRNGKNTVIGLRKKIPVIITYWTCGTDGNNQIYFFKDIYGRDKYILKELNKKEGCK